MKIEIVEFRLGFGVVKDNILVSGISAVAFPRETQHQGVLMNTERIGQG